MEINYPKHVPNELALDGRFDQTGKMVYHLLKHRVISSCGFLRLKCQDAPIKSPEPRVDHTSQSTPLKQTSKLALA